MEITTSVSRYVKEGNRWNKTGGTKDVEQKMLNKTGGTKQVEKLNKTGGTKQVEQNRWNKTG